MNVIGDALESAGTVIDGIHRGHVGEKSLGGADVAGGFFAADMLLASLEGEAISGSAAHVARNTDDAAGNLTFEFIFCGDECGVRAAITERDAETLRVAEGNVRAEFAGWLQ